MLIGIIVTRYLGTELKGLQVFILLIFGLLVPTLMFGFTAGFRYYISTKKYDIRNTLFSVLTVGLILSLFIAAIVFSLKHLELLGKGGAAISKDLWILVFLGILPIVYQLFLSRILISKSLFTLNNRFVIIYNLVYAVGAALVVYYFNSGVYGIICCYLLGQMIYFVLLFIELIKRFGIKLKLRLDYLIKSFQYGIKAWLSEVLRISNRRIDQFILGILLPIEALGLYSVSVTVSELAQRIPQSSIQVFYNQIATSNKDEGVILLAKVHRIILTLTLIFGLILALIGKILIVLLYGEDFSGSYSMLLWYLPGAIIYMGTRIYLQYFSASGMPIVLSYIQLSGLIVGIPAYFILIPIFGANGAAMSSSLAYLITNIAAFIFFNRTNESVNISDMFIPKRSDVKWLMKSIPQKFKRINF